MSDTTRPQRVTITKTEQRALLNQALAALECCGPGSSKAQLLNQINYARGRLKTAQEAS